MVRYTAAVAGVVAGSLLLLLGAGQPLQAQVIGTQCWNNNGVVQCNSQAGILYTGPSGWDVAAKSFAQAFAQSFEQARALRAQRQQQAQAAIDRAATATDVEREAAMRRLFMERVSAVLQHLSDSLRIFGEAGRRFLEATGPSVADLYVVNPLASREEIMGALWPHLQKVGNDFTAYVTRVAPPNKPAVDSLGLHPDELQLLVAALGPVTQDAFMLNPDGTAADYRAAIDPLLKRARVYFDSTRAAVKPR